MVPFQPGVTPVRFAGVIHGEEEQANLKQVIDSFHLTAGHFCEKLEADLAKWFGVRYARLTNSGSSANLLAISALTSPLLGKDRLVPGDEVITVAAGFPTTVAPIVQNGLVPVFVDVESPNYNVNVSMLERAYTKRTRAVVLAHTLGMPFDLEVVDNFCLKHGLFFVEDNCDAAGAEWRGAKTGSFGHLATLSFYPAHQMTTGEGGAVLIGQSSHASMLLRAVQSLRDWGRDCWCAPNCDNTCGKRFAQQHGSLPPGYDHKYVYTHLGYNLRMTELQAAIGVAQLERLAGFVKARRKNGAYFRKELDDHKEIFDFQRNDLRAAPSPFGFLVTVQPGYSRDAIVRFLESRKIQTRPLFAGNLLRHPAMSDVKHRIVGSRSLPCTDAAMNSAFWFGVWPGLQEEEKEYVVESMHAAVQRA